MGSRIGAEYRLEFRPKADLNDINFLLSQDQYLPVRFLHGAFYVSTV